MKNLTGNLSLLLLFAGIAPTVAKAASLDEFTTSRINVTDDVSSVLMDENDDLAQQVGALEIELQEFETSMPDDQMEPAAPIWEETAIDEAPAMETAEPVEEAGIIESAAKTGELYPVQIIGNGMTREQVIARMDQLVRDGAALRDRFAAELARYQGISEEQKRQKISLRTLLEEARGLLADRPFWDPNRHQQRIREIISKCKTIADALDISRPLRDASYQELDRINFLHSCAEDEWDDLRRLLNGLPRLPAR